MAVHAKGGRPTANYLEFGIFGGVMIPSDYHNLVDAATDAGLKPHRNFERPSPDFGARIAYFPWKFVGIEAEGAYIPSGTPTDNGSATLWALRGNLIAQWPIGIVTPFVLGGFGRLGAKSTDMGSDSDPAIDFGGGLKVALGNVFQIRLDGRDTLTQRYNASQGAQANSPEVLLGVSAAIGLSSHAKPLPPPPPKDTDGDGIPDSRDKCPTVAGPPPDGCPIKIKVPKKVQKFTGVIAGIRFNFGKSTIRPESRPTLDAAVKVLKQYPNVRIEIRGYTDNLGSPAHNLALSEARAEAVKDYLVSKGIDASRIQTKGFGESEPIGNNATAAGRRKNRRIEFKLLSD